MNLESFRPWTRFGRHVRRRILPLFLCLAAAAPTRADLARPPLVIEPERADLGDIPAGTRLGLDFVITNGADTPVRLRYIHARCDCSLAVPAEGLVAAGGEFLLHAELVGDGTERGVLDEEITILTDCEFQPELSIPVTARFVGHREGGR